MDRNIVITGASRGIGRAAAELFLEDGDRVLAHYNRCREGVETLMARWPGQVIPYGCDLGQPGAPEALARHALETLGRVDVLVNNAGIARRELFVDMEAEGWAQLCAVNLTAPMLLTRALLPGMLERGAGSVINVSSVWGRVGGSCEVAYSAAKAGLIGFTQALAKEVGLMGVRVNAVAPGVIDTDMCAALTAEDRAALAESTALGRIGTAREAAGAIFLLAGESARFITGAVLPVDGGFTG